MRRMPAHALTFPNHVLRFRDFVSKQGDEIIHSDDSKNGLQGVHDRYPPNMVRVDPRSGAHFR